jgi:hypothetical protein
VPDFITKPPYNVIQPGAYSAVNASQLANPSFGAGHPIPCIIGPALGGQPNTALFFRSPGQLQQVLRGGAGYDVARFTFDGGAPQVAFVRVGNSITQASLPLAGTGTVLTLTALDWGAWANAIKITVATGPIITLSYTDALGNVFTEKWDFTGVGSLTVPFIVQAINGQQPGYSGSNFVSATAGAGTLPLTTVSNTPLVGGTDGLAPAAGDWTNGLTAIESKLVDFVIPATGDATVHAQVLTHCQNTSTPAARRERVASLGGVLGESVSQVVTRIASLRSGRIQLVYPGMQDFDANGNLVLYDPFYLAGKIAGMHCAASDPATSLVHQHVPVVAAETDLSTVQGGAIDQLLQAGVTPIAPAGDGSGYWIVDDLTGYNAADGVFRDLIKTRSADYVAQYARSSLETQFVGSKNLATSGASIAAAANQVMTNLLGLQIIQQFKAAVVSAGPKVGSWNVQLPVMLVDTDKFIFIQVALQPSSTVQSSTTTQDLG